MPEPAALGAEFVRWEIATAVAGALLEINPFDEPNVAQAKEATRIAALPVPSSKASCPCRRRTGRPSAGVTLTLSSGARARALEALATPTHRADTSCADRRGDYFALLAYLGPDPELAAALHPFRMAVRDARTRRCDDVRLRSAISAFDRSAAQGRTEQRRLHRRDRRVPTSRLPHSRERRFRSAPSSSRRRSAISQSLDATDAGRCTCSCPSRTRSASRRRSLRAARPSDRAFAN